MQATVAIARLTLANGIRQPVTWLSTAVALALLLLCVLFGMFNFQTEDRMRLLLTAGVAVNILNGLFLGVLAASAAVHDELASRTALTLFAKPMSRGSFLFGKAMGVWGIVAIVSTVILICHLLAIGIVERYGFDFYGGGGGHSHDHGGGEVTWVPWGRTIAAHALAVVSSIVMTALAATLALRLSLVPTILICFGVFVLAHLAAGTGHATTAAGILPALALFTVDESLQFEDMPLSGLHFVLCVAYGGLYAAGSLLIGLALFKRQDIP